MGRGEGRGVSKYDADEEFPEGWGMDIQKLNRLGQKLPDNKLTQRTELKDAIFTFLKLQPLL